MMKTVYKIQVLNKKKSYSKREFKQKHSNKKKIMTFNL